MSEIPPENATFRAYSHDDVLQRKVTYTNRMSMALKYS